MDAASSAPRAPRSPAKYGLALPAEAAQQLTAWAFIAPVAIYMIVFYAFPLLPQPRPELPRLHAPVLHRRHRPVRVVRQLRRRHPELRPSRRRSSTRRSSPSSPSLFQFSHRPGARGLLLQALPARPPRFAHCSSCRGCCRCWCRHRSWAWMLNSESGVVNAGLAVFGIPQINWLTSPQWAMVSVLLANIWIGIPFNLVILYSGLQDIPNDIYEAASLDGANALADVLAHHLPPAAPRLGDHDPARPRLHAEGVRHHLDHDPRRAGQLRRPRSRSGRTGSASAAARPNSAPPPQSATC